MTHAKKQTCLVLLISLFSVAAFAAPTRIVSMNLCADEMVLALADREHIQSVSWFVANPDMSWSAEQAAGIPVNHGLAEEIIPLTPDLVVTGRFSNPATKDVLRRLGIPVFEISLATDLGSISRQIRSVAQVLQQEERGEGLVSAMQERFTQLGSGEPYAHLSAVVYEPNGYVAGVGSLAHEVIQVAGLRNLAVDLELVNYGQFPLELLIVNRPDVLIMNRLNDAAPSLAHAVLDHPALTKAFGAKEIVSIPSQAWACGSPKLLDAVAELRRAADLILASRTGLE
jgi:iron complex transport system substrate-binding protein